MKKFVLDIYNIVSTNRKYHFWIFLIILAMLGVWMVYCYSQSYGHDFFFHERRFNALTEALQNGTFPYYTDYLAINGYGYFTKGFYPDFILIPFALIDVVSGYHYGYTIMIYTMTILCGIFMYKMIISIRNNTFVASVAAILYTYSCYRVLDVYRRAALGEALSFTFLPIVFLGLYHIIKGDYKKWYVIAIGFALLILTHVISSILMFVTLIIFLAIYHRDLLKEPKRIYYLILAGIVTVPLAAYYLFPFLEQFQSNTFYFETLPAAEVADSTLPFTNMVWALFYGIIQYEQFFIPALGILLSGVIFIRIFIYAKSNQLKTADTLAIIGIAYLIAVMPFFPWNIFPFSLLNIIQLPWRLFEFVTFFFSISGAYYLFLLLTTRKRKHIGYLAVIVFSALLMVSDGVDVRNKTVRLREDMTPTVENKYNLIGMEYMPAKVPSLEYPNDRGDTIISKQGYSDISDFKRKESIISFNKQSDKDDELELPLLYYKGYAAYIGNQSLLVKESDNGLVEITVNESGNVKVYYKGTIIQKLGFYITILSAILLCIYIFVYRKKRTSKI